MLKQRMWPVYPAALAAAALLAGAAGTAASTGTASAARLTAVAGTAPPGAATARLARSGPRMGPIGAAPALPPGARLAGPARRSATLHITVALRPADPAGLARLATQVATSGTARFRHFLHPAQVQRRFGPPPSALAGLGAWLRRQHLTTQPVLGDGLLLPAIGSVGQVEAAFHVKIARVRLPGGRLAWLNLSAPELPVGLGLWVTAVTGLDNVSLLHPELVRGSASHPGRGSARRPGRRQSVSRPAWGPGGASSVPGPRACRAARATRHVYTAAWLAHAYKFDPLYRQGDFGQHITVALFEEANYANRDIRVYGRCYGISPSVRRVRVDGGTTVAASGDGTEEVTADIEVVAAMAPRASILVYEAPTNGGAAAGLDNYGTIVQQDRAQVVSTSWGGCEPSLGGRVLLTEAELFQEMALQGQSMLAAAGDEGSEDCLPPVPRHRADYSLQVDDPGSQPFVTSVGGTEITRFGSPPVQVAWNQSPYGQGFPAPFDGRRGRPAETPGNLVGGGGISRVWLMPAWQAGFDHSGNSSSAPCDARRGQDCREVPDVSALAAVGVPNLPRHGIRGTRGYVIYGTAGVFRGEGWQTSGGTSLATPLWAALTALADQQAAGHRLGLLAPSLYRIDRADPRALTDVVAGNNDYLSRNGRYSHHTCRYDGRRGRACYRAVRGYDMATGLGTPQASYLVADLLAEHSRAGRG
ncbi:MAG TPA: S53 family peptidase [Streptosporangiaceae bacterium]|nr:S53 family peptidase [Streptosporangiaceae bacterium]